MGRQKSNKSCSTGCPFLSKLALNAKQLIELDFASLACAAHCPYRQQLRMKRNIALKQAGSGNPSAAGSNAAGAARTDSLASRKPISRAQQKVFESLARDVMSNDAAAQLRAVVRIRNMVCEPNPPVQEIISCGVVPHLVNFLSRHDSQQLQKEAAWALTNILSGKEEHTDYVIRNGAIPKFIELLRSPNAAVADQAVWALGNIAGDTLACRNMVLEQGAMPAILDLLKRKDLDISFVRNLVWAISNICRFRPRPFPVLASALTTLAEQLNSTDEQVLCDACWCFSYLSDDDSEQGAFIKAVVATGVCKRLVELLMHPNHHIQTTALRSVGNIVTGDDLDTQAILDYNPLPSLLHLLQHPNGAIRKEAAWTISNITAGPAAHIQAVIDAGIIPALVPLARTAQFDLKTEAAYAIYNATAMATKEQIEYLVSQGVITPLCELLDLGLEHSGFVPMLTIAMNALDNILFKGQTTYSSQMIGPGPNQSPEHDDYPGGELPPHLDSVQPDVDRAVTPAAGSVGAAVAATVNSVSINSVAATAPAATGSVPDSERPHHHNQQMQPQAGANAPRDPTLQSQCSSCGRRMEDHVTDPVTGHVHAPHQHHHSVTDVPAPAAAAATADVSTQLVATDSAAPASSTASSTAVTSVVSRAVTSPVDSLTVAAVDSINRAQLHNHASSYVLNRYAMLVFQSNGLDKLEALQAHEHPQIASQASKIMASYTFLTPEQQTSRLERGNQYLGKLRHRQEQKVVEKPDSKMRAYANQPLGSRQSSKKSAYGHPVGDKRPHIPRDALAGGDGSAGGVTGLHRASSDQSHVSEDDLYAEDEESDYEGDELDEDGDEYDHVPAGDTPRASRKAVYDGARRGNVTESKAVPKPAAAGSSGGSALPPSSLVGAGAGSVSAAAASKKKAAKKKKKKKGASGTAGAGAGVDASADSTGPAAMVDPVLAVTEPAGSTSNGTVPASSQPEQQPNSQPRPSLSAVNANADAASVSRTVDAGTVPPPLPDETQSAVAAASGTRSSQPNGDSSGSRSTVAAVEGPKKPMTKRKMKKLNKKLRAAQVRESSPSNSDDEDDDDDANADGGGSGRKQTGSADTAASAPATAYDPFQNVVVAFPNSNARSSPARKTKGKEHATPMDTGFTVIGNKKKTRGSKGNSATPTGSASVGSKEYTESSGSAAGVTPGKSSTVTAVAPAMAVAPVANSTPLSVLSVNTLASSATASSRKRQSGGQGTPSASSTVSAAPAVSASLLQTPPSTSSSATVRAKLAAASAQVPVNSSANGTGTAVSNGANGASAGTASAAAAGVPYSTYAAAAGGASAPVVSPRAAMASSPTPPVASPLPAVKAGPASGKATSKGSSVAAAWLPRPSPTATAQASSLVSPSSFPPLGAHTTSNVPQSAASTNGSTGAAATSFTSPAGRNDTGAGKAFNGPSRPGGVGGNAWGAMPGAAAPTAASGSAGAARAWKGHLNPLYKGGDVQLATDTNGNPQPSKLLVWRNYSNGADWFDTDTLGSMFGQRYRVVIHLVNSKRDGQCAVLEYASPEEALAVRNELAGREVNAGRGRVGFVDLAFASDPLTVVSDYAQGGNGSGARVGSTVPSLMSPSELDTNTSLMDSVVHSVLDGDDEFGDAGPAGAAAHAHSRNFAGSTTSPSRAAAAQHAFDADDSSMRAPGSMRLGASPISGGVGLLANRSGPATSLAPNSSGGFGAFYDQPNPFSPNMNGSAWPSNAQGAASTAAMMRSAPMMNGSSSTWMHSSSSMIPDSAAGDAFASAAFLRGQTQGHPRAAGGRAADPFGGLHQHKRVRPVGSDGDGMSSSLHSGGISNSSSSSSNGGAEKRASHMPMRSSGFAASNLFGGTGLFTMASSAEHGAEEHGGGDDAFADNWESSNAPDVVRRAVDFSLDDSDPAHADGSGRS